ncbi:putative glycerol-3-phosphate acyltransferase 2 [Senna tora]|uniref:Putative glycerol-3-phosphate acyltransferase 2 n=1 Tax=Senna tora TaxID=362788 RepID=A0A835CGZ9_9FABA|nr:putative glycerol-3-phosphate acyltransferase 2 [Senna tora]
MPPPQLQLQSSTEDRRRLPLIFKVPILTSHQSRPHRRSNFSRLHPSLFTVGSSSNVGGFAFTLQSPSHPSLFSNLLPQVPSSSLPSSTEIFHYKLNSETAMATISHVHKTAKMSNKILVFHFESDILRSNSLFPYFMLIVLL